MNDCNKTHQSAPVSFTGPKQQALHLLSQGYTKCETARQLGVNRTTVHRWLEDPLFVAELHRLRNRLTDDCRERLLSLAPLALDVLESDLRSPNTHPLVRQKAAIEVLKRVGLEIQLPEARSSSVQAKAAARDKLKKLPREMLKSLHEIKLHMERMD